MFIIDHFYGAGGLLFDQYKDSANKKGLSHKIIFVGISDDVPRYLKLMDLACLVPGKNEGFSNSILEKMAVGLPLIVADVGGNREAVIDGYNGLVIPPNNANALAEAIWNIYHNKDRRREMDIRLHQGVEECFTLQKMINEHEKYYEFILNGSKP